QYFGRPPWILPTLQIEAAVEQLAAVRGPGEVAAEAGAATMIQVARGKLPRGTAGGRNGENLEPPLRNDPAPVHSIHHSFDDHRIGHPLGAGRLSGQRDF